MNWKRLPWSLWGPLMQLRLGETKRRAFRRLNVGENSYIDPTVQIFGWEHVTIGRKTVISEGTWLNASARAASKDRIVIGDYCHIGRRNYFSTGGLIHVKDFGFTGIGCHFLGCGHNVDAPFVPYIDSGLTLGATIELGVNCWLTTDVTVLEGVNIGCGAVIGTRSLVSNSIPPFSVAIGNPCRVVKRFDFKNACWTSLASFDEALTAYMPNEAEYLDILRKKSEHVGLSLHAGSTRFGWLK